MAGLDFAAQKFPDAGEMRLRGHASLDGSAAGRKFVEDGNFEIAVESERKGARNGSSSRDEDVRRVTVPGGFVHEALALEDAEAVLFVDGNEAEAMELDVVFDQGVGADDELRFAGADTFASGSFFGGFETADEEFDVIATGGEQAARGEEMLDGEDFGGRH